MKLIDDNFYKHYNWMLFGIVVGVIFMFFIGLYAGLIPYCNVFICN